MVNGCMWLESAPAVCTGIVEKAAQAATADTKCRRADRTDLELVLDVTATALLVLRATAV